MQDRDFKTDQSPKPSLGWRGAVGFLSFTFGACALFALIATLGEGWVEYRQSRWPETTARIAHCALKELDSARNPYVAVECRIAFTRDGGAVEAKVRSRTCRASQGGPLQEWAESHPDGAPISARYDPSNDHNVVLVTDDPAIWGPRTPFNLELFALFAFASLATFGVVRIGRR